MDDFFASVALRKLRRILERLQFGRILTLCVWLAYVGVKKPLQLNERTILLQPKLRYVPVEEVNCPETPYFIEDVQNPFRTPRITAPRVCELCGVGFLNRSALRDHAMRARGSVAEMRKIIFWHAEQVGALPLFFTRKRN